MWRWAVVTAYKPVENKSKTVQPLQSDIHEYDLVEWPGSDKITIVNDTGE